MKTLLAVLALTLAVAARAQQDARQHWERIEGTSSGVTETRVVTIRDAAQWREIWRQHDSAEPAPAVDFENETVIAVFLGEQRTTSVSVRIVVQQDPIDPARLNVFYREVVTKKSMSATVICHPFAIIKVRRAEVIDIERDAPVKTPETANPPQPAKRDNAKVKALLRGLENPRFDGN